MVESELTAASIRPHNVYTLAETLPHRKFTLSGSHPLYMQVKTAVLDRIRSGDWPPGGRLPSETQLAQDFGCSRLTVHRAIRELAHDGVVERRRRAGTRVAQADGVALEIHIRRITQEISQRGFAYSYDLLNRTQKNAPAYIAKLFDIPPTQKMLHVQCRHRAGERVFQLEDRWINLDAIPQAMDQGFEHESPGLWMLDHVPFSRMNHDISACIATAATARHLEVETGTAVLQLKRQAEWNGRAITCATLSHPADLYSLHPESRSL